MKFRLIAILLLAVILVGCTPEAENSGLSQEELLQIIAEDMDIPVSDIVDLHAHMALNGEIPVYNLYFSVKGVSYVYVVNAVSGEILSSGEGEGHHH